MEAGHKVWIRDPNEGWTSGVITKKVGQYMDDLHVLIV